jgi:hypothetical protein
VQSVGGNRAGKQGKENIRFYSPTPTPLFGLT